MSERVVWGLRGTGIEIRRSTAEVGRKVVAPHSIIHSTRVCTHSWVGMIVVARRRVAGVSWIGLIGLLVVIGRLSVVGSIARGLWGLVKGRERVSHGLRQIIFKMRAAIIVAGSSAGA
jgi:hypothetical protein